MKTARDSYRIIGAALAGLTVAVAAFAQQPADPYAAVVGYKFDQPRTVVVAIEAEVHAAKPDQLRVIEAKLLKVLQSPDATTDAEQWVCRQLRQVGSEQSVAALAALLADKEVAPVAQFALRSIPGAKVDAALRDALGKVEGNLKAGVIQTIGARGDCQAVALLAPLASDYDAIVAEAALYALGSIGGADALKALQAAKVTGGLRRYRNHAMLLCAESLAAEGKTADASAAYHAIYKEASDRIIKLGALRGILRADKAKAAPVMVAALREDNAAFCASAARFLCEPGCADVLQVVLADMASLPADVQAMILNLVADPVALPAVRSAVRSREESLRLAALGAMGRLDDAASVPLLLGVAAREKEQAQAVARRSLLEIRSKDADTVFIAAAQSGETALRTEAIRTLAARNATGAVPTLLKLATDADSLVRSESLEALGALADAGTLPSVVKLLVEAQAKADRAAVEKALLAASRRIVDKDAAVTPILAALPGPSVEMRCALLRVLARIPSAKSLDALRAAAKDSDASVKDTAIRGLADWPDAAAMPDLLDVARATDNQTHKVLALRGFVRLAVLPGSCPPEQTVKLLARALSLAHTTDLQKMVLAALGNVAHPTALELAASCLPAKDADVEVAAAAAVAQIAKNVRHKNRDAAKAAVQKVLDMCKTPAARQLAENAFTNLDNMVNIASKGTASSPDGLKDDGASKGAQAAIDGNPDTYWDKQDNQKLYRLVVTFKQPEKIAAISILGYQHHNYAPKDFEIVCDGKAAKKIENAQYDNNFLVVTLDETTCTTVELKITDYYGRSPGIRELGIHAPGGKVVRPEMPTKGKARTGKRGT